VRHDQVHRLRQQQLLAQILRVRRRCRPVRCLVAEHQRDVDVAGPQHPHCLGRLRLGQPQVDARVPVVEDRRGGRHDRTQRGRERGQPQSAGPQAGEHRELVLGRVEAADHLGGALGQQPPRVGEPDAAPGPLDQLSAGLRLEPGQVMADRRLGVVQRVRRRGDRSVPGHRDQHTKPGYIQHGPTIDAVDWFAQTPIPYQFVQLRRTIHPARGG
jgi:hypothetical protein